MKQFNLFNTKWILTASLLAVLGAQYSYQSSSLDIPKYTSAPNYGEFVFASEDDTKTTKAAEEKKQTEAGSSEEGTCKNCQNISLSAENIQEFIKAMTDLKLIKADYEKLKIASEPKAATTTPAPETKTEIATEDEYGCDLPTPEDTREDKRNRRECIKEAKKQAKLDKEAEKQDLLVEKFEDKMEDLKFKCDGDVTCLADGFSTEIGRYTGKKSLPAATVAKAYVGVVGNQLKKDLYSTDELARERANGALQSIMQNMPEKYNALKQDAIKTVKAQSTAAATVVSQEYANSSELLKQGKTQESYDALVQAKIDHNNLAYTINNYSSSIAESLQTVGDSSTFAFYQKSYLPDMNKIMSSIATGVSTSSTTTVDPKNNTRGGRTDETTLPGSNSSTNTSLDNGKMTRGGSNNTEWTFPSGNQGLTIGNPQDNSRGGRGPRTMN